MHEASIAQGIIDSVGELQADGTAAGRVLKVFIRVGRLTAVIPENLRFLYGVMVEGTALAGSSLEIEMIAISAACRECRSSFEIDEPCFLCPNCRSPEVEVVSGRELEIAALEVE